MRLYLLIAFFAMCMCFGLANADDKTLYVKARDAKLVSSIQQQKSLQTLDRGDSLQKISYKSQWYEVTTIKGKKVKGWIYQGKVDKKQPKQDTSLTAKKGNPLASEDFPPSSGLRGVSPTAQEFGKKNGITKKHEKYLDFHQSYISTDKDFAPKISTDVSIVKLTSADIDGFLQEGKLGEYAEIKE